MAGKKRLITPEQIEASRERRRAWDRARHAKHKEMRNAARRAAHAVNPERLREKDRERYRENPLQKKRNDVRSKYGAEAHEAFRAIHHCEACGDHVSGPKKHIDHDHALPRRMGFRGILCGACNVALGYLKEDERRILGLLKYLKSKGRKTMKTFKVVAAQGDILIRRIDALPEGLKPAKAEGGHFIVAHSETGHHHVVKERSAQLLIDETNAFISYLAVKEPAELEHLRPHDTHETIAIPPGNYEIRRQREYVPEGFRRVED